jgi:hypothetical protein
LAGSFGRSALAYQFPGSGNFANVLATVGGIPPIRPSMADRPYRQPGSHPLGKLLSNYPEWWLQIQGSIHDKAVFCTYWAWRMNYGSSERNRSMKSAGAIPCTPCSMGKVAPTWKTKASGSFLSRQSLNTPDSNSW